MCRCVVWCQYTEVSKGSIASVYRVGIILFSTASRLTLGPTHSFIQRIPGALSLGVKRPRREVDHSPPSTPEVKNTCNYNVITPIIVAARSRAYFRPLKHWDHGFESHLRHECLCAFILCLRCSVCRYRPCEGLIPRPRGSTGCVKNEETEKSAKAQPRAVEP
jgi:hypothetical protein